MLWKSFKIGKILGIPIYLHWSFLLLPVLVIFNNDWEISTSLFWEIGLIAALFVCVLLHELGHAVAARRYQVPTLDIILSVIGGVARLTKLPEKPFHEFMVAVAGPLVNVLIALVLSVYLFFSGKLELPYLGYIGGANFIQLLALTNVVLVLFNLIPAFPMDGGRMFRALLAMRIGRVKATRIAMIVGQVIAVGFAFLGFYTSDYMLIFIGIFVFMSAASEYRTIRSEGVFEGYSVGQAMRTHFEVLQGSTTIAQATQRLMQSGQQHFPVFNLMVFEGFLTHANLIRALSEKQSEALVADYMSQDFAPIAPSTPLRDALQLLQEHHYSVLPVMENGQLVGLIDNFCINEFYQLRTAASEN